MPQYSTVAVAPIKRQDLTALHRISNQPLVTMEMAKLQYSVLVMADENAPHFLPANEPAADGRLYKATDGKRYYRPQFRLASNTGDIPGPDVRFLKDADGNVRLHLELEEVPSGFNDAQPFAVRVNGLTVHWGSGSKEFPAPSIFFDNAQPGGEPRVLIRAGVALSPQELEPLYSGMQEDAQLRLRLSFGYWVDSPQAPPSNSSTVLVDPGMFNFGRLRVVGGVTAREPVASQPPPRRGRVVDRRTRNKPVIGRFNARAVDWSKVVAGRTERKTKPDFREVTLNRQVAFTLDADLAQNRPVYAAIRAEDDHLDTQWTDTQFGFIRQAEFANTIYRLPDELRLAFNPDLGAPHVIPQLYRDANEAVRVRVSMRIVPYHDPRKIIDLRDFLYRDSAGGLANPSVIVGGYEAASLRFTTAFPEEISVIGGTEMGFALESGAEMTLDTSLEFYRYLAELLTSPIGVTGEVAVTLETDAEGDAVVKRVPMRLVLDDLAGIGLEVQPVAQEISPTEIDLANVTRAAIHVDDCVLRLLQIDENSVLPLAVFRATSEGSFPAVVEPGQALRVAFSPEGDTDEMWNGVQAELTGPRLTSEPQAILDHIHEIAPSGSLTWKIRVECPVFLADPVPDQYATLYRVRVTVKRPGYAEQEVLLGREQARGEVTMQRTLREIVARDGAEDSGFTYRVQNIYFDREGPSTEEKTAQGENLFVFPNAIGG